MRRSSALGLAAATLAGPTVLTVTAPVRRQLLPRLAGISPLPHVALTFDDGPDGAGTPAVLDALARRQVRATFFLLGERVNREAALVRRMAAEGHEVAVHGWSHRTVALVPPRRLTAELTRARELVAEVSGQPVRWYRPPYGVWAPHAGSAARAAGLRTVLWSTWGRDWEAGATPASVVRRVEARLRPGGTVLLHDTNRLGRGDWRTTLAATETLLDRWAARGLAVGPLAEHWPAETRTTRPAAAPLSAAGPTAPEWRGAPALARAVREEVG